MPRLPVDYSKTIIYKIICDDLPEFIYVGSTTDFRKRKCKHKTDCNNETGQNYNLKLYKTIRENGGFENWKMIEIERFTECIDGNSARKREQYFMDEFKSNLNTYKAFQTEEQLKTYNQAYQKQYCIDNVEQKKEYAKQYYIENKEHKKEHDKQYYIENAEKIKKRISQTFTCECGSVCQIGNKTHHLKTKKHIKRLAIV